MKKYLIAALCCLLLTGCALGPGNPAPTVPSTAGETDSVQIPLLLYLPNDNADGFLTKEASLPELDGQEIFALLIAEGVLNADVRVNTLTVSGSELILDVNGAFLSQLVTYGTSGEYMMMGSVVNTLLSAYGARSLTITAEGEIMESGHVIYDMPLTFHE